MPEVQAPIVVLVLDDHALFREGIARLLSAEASFEVEQCGSIQEAMTTLQQKHIDIVLLDYDLGDQDGTQFMAEAKEHGFTGKVLVVTAGVEDDEAARLIRTGVSGIFMKQNSAASLAQGIREVMGGKVWFDEEMLRNAMAGVSWRQQPQSQRFTARERQVLSFVFDGLANKQIAQRIGVSESAIKATLQQLFSKTGVRTRSQLVRIALEQYKEQF
jgi:two-component system, NarL family, nitrate/nitrite response regulator NarL